MHPTTANRNTKGPTIRAPNSPHGDGTPRRQRWVCRGREGNTCRHTLFLIAHISGLCEGWRRRRLYSTKLEASESSPCLAASQRFSLFDFRLRFDQTNTKLPLSLENCTELRTTGVHKVARSALTQTNSLFAKLRRASTIQLDELSTTTDWSERYSTKSLPRSKS